MCYSVSALLPLNVHLHAHTHAHVCTLAHREREREEERAEERERGRERKRGGEREYSFATCRMSNQRLAHSVQMFCLRMNKLALRAAENDDVTDRA